MEHDPTRRSRPATILLVEDEAAVRNTIRIMLEQEGYEVREAASGAEAVAAVEKSCPDLLLSDLVLPPPNGQELANLCRARCPDTILVFMSGYSEDELHELDIRQVVFIPKPIDPDQLNSSLARLLGGNEDD